MFNLFKKKELSHKEKINEIHMSYKNKKIDYDEYQDKFVRAIFDVFLSEEAKRVLDKYRIDVCDCDRTKTYDFSSDEISILIRDSKYLSNVISKMNDLVKERKEMKNPDYLKYDTRYEGVQIVSYDEIIEIAKTVEKAEKKDGIDKPDLWWKLTRIEFSTCVNQLQMMGLTYTRMINAGAIVE